MATCPDCEFDEIDLEDYEDGDTLSCPECGRTLLVSDGDLEFADDDDGDDDLDDDDEEQEDGEEDLDDGLDEDEEEEEDFDE